MAVHHHPAVGGAPLAPSYQDDPLAVDTGRMSNFGIGPFPPTPPSAPASAATPASNSDAGSDGLGAEVAAGSPDGGGRDTSDAAFDLLLQQQSVMKEEQSEMKQEMEKMRKVMEKMYPAVVADAQEQQQKKKKKKWFF